MAAQPAFQTYIDAAIAEGNEVVKQHRGFYRVRTVDPDSRRLRRVEAAAEVPAGYAALTGALQASVIPLVLNMPRLFAAASPEERLAAFTDMVGAVSSSAAVGAAAGALRSSFVRALKAHRDHILSIFTPSSITSFARLFVVSTSTVG